MPLTWTLSRRLLLPLLAAPLLLHAQGYKTQNIILVTADGLRWQDVFRGADPEFLNGTALGMKNAADVRDRFSGATAQERRAKLMPFLWSHVAQKGVLFGNRDLGSEVNIRNRHRFSYPGYSEILTGRPQDEAVKSNENKPNPTPTVLEIARESLKLSREKVALFGSWDVFSGIGAHAPGSVFINAGYAPLQLSAKSEKLQYLDSLQADLLTPWNSVRHDYLTFEMALEYLRTRKPRVMHVALGETDDWAHDQRYDRYLQMAHYLDQSLRRLWEAVEADPAYRGRTTILVTVDHGRGSTAAEFPKHGDKIEGAQHIWLAAFGPDTPAVGEANNAPVLTQSDVAPTMLELLGIDYRKLTDVQGKPASALIGRP